MTLDKSPETIRTMFDLIAEKYDFVNNLMSLGTQKFIKIKSIKNLDIKPHDRVLDLCTGTGDLARITKKMQPLAEVTGIDFSKNMLGIAKNKSSGISYFQGSAADLPYEDNYFDFVTMGFGLRNIQNAEKAVEEIYRVLKSGGCFLHLDFGEKNFISKVYDIITPILVKIFTDNTEAYSYLIKSKNEFLLPADLIKDFESKGFQLKKRNDYLLGVISAQIMVKK